MGLRSLVPFLQVTDLKAAEEFYGKLGFTIAWRYPDDVPTHMSLCSSAVELSFVQVQEGTRIEKADLYIHVDDIEVYHDKIACLMSTSGLIRSSYGMLDFSIHDPWGHHLVFGTPIQKEEKISLEPILRDGAFAFITGYHPHDQLDPIMTFEESEGTTAILPYAQAKSITGEHLARWAMISLGYESSLEMVGLTAKISAELAAADISCNVVAAYHHDHIFVPEDKAPKAHEIISRIRL